MDCACHENIIKIHICTQPCQGDSSARAFPKTTCKMPKRKLQLQVHMSTSAADFSESLQPQCPQTATPATSTCTSGSPQSTTPATKMCKPIIKPLRSPAPVTKVDFKAHTGSHIAFQLPRSLPLRLPRKVITKSQTCARHHNESAVSKSTRLGPSASLRSTVNGSELAGHADEHLRLDTHTLQLP